MKNIPQARPIAPEQPDPERLAQFKLKESQVRRVRMMAAALGMNSSQALSQILAEYFTAEDQRQRKAS